MAEAAVLAALPAHRGRLRAQRIVLGWVLLGLAAFALLPWYFPQNLTLWKSLPGVFGGSDTASGLVQAAAHHKPWLWAGLAGLAVALAAWRAAGRARAGPRCCWAAPRSGWPACWLGGFGIGARGLVLRVPGSAGSARCPAGSSASAWAARWCCCRC